MAAPRNVRGSVLDSVNQTVLMFDKTLATALGEEKIQEILDIGTKPLVNELNNEVKRYETGENVRIVFGSIPSRKMGNVRRIGPMSSSRGWQTLHLIEYGTVLRKKKDGSSTGVMPAAGFMRRAVANNRPGVIKGIVRLTMAAIEKATKQNGLKTEK
jgi:hypothetical protein